MKKKNNTQYKNVWKDGSLEFMDIRHISQEKILHPKIAEMVNNFNPKTILDYGVGDGRLIQFFNKTDRIDVFDINKNMLKLTKQKNGQRINSYFNDVNDIPVDYYDVVILSMVLVCIHDNEEYRNILNNVRKSKKESGYAVIAVTHPCFRTHEFSNFSTSYTKSNKSFYYLNEGDPFLVNLKDSPKHEIVFQDYHWSLSYTLNSIIKSGLQIVELYETTDYMKAEKSNHNVSPYLIITVK